MQLLIGSNKKDWKCLSSPCGNLNFSFRTECHRCKAPRKGQVSKPDTDWQCPEAACGNINVSFRKECQRCKVPLKKIVSLSVTGNKQSDKEWKCLKASCGNINFVYRKKCNRCKIPKGETGIKFNIPLLLFSFNSSFLFLKI